MLAVLRADGWLRRVAGIGCAYAFALQMLFAGVLATQMAVASPLDAVICASGQPANAQGGNSGGHVHHFHCVACALVTFATPPLDAAHVQPVPAVIAAPLQPAAAALAAINPRHTPRSSQGPPRTA